MAKKDYVLINALKGDLDALENILGRIYAPNFDLAFHTLNDKNTAKECLREVLKNTRDLLLTGDLDGDSPIHVATAFTLAILKEKTSCVGVWNEVLGGVKDQESLVLLTHLSLDIHGVDLDRLFDLDEGEGDELVAQFFANSGVNDSEWREILDRHASSVSLPSGLIDPLIDELED